MKIKVVILSLLSMVSGARLSATDAVAQISLESLERLIQNGRMDTIATCIKNGRLSDSSTLSKGIIFAANLEKFDIATVLLNSLNLELYPKIILEFDFFLSEEAVGFLYNLLSKDSCSAVIKELIKKGYLHQPLNMAQELMKRRYQAYRSPQDEIAGFREKRADIKERRTRQIVDVSGGSEILEVD